LKLPFTQLEYETILSCPEIDGFWHWGVQLGWWLGLRISDVALLQWGSFCAVPGKLVVWQTKTRRRMEIDLNDPLLGGGILAKVMAEVRANATDATYCFPAARDMYLKNAPSLSTDFYRACRLAGVYGKTFHCLRKSAALRWQDAGRSIMEIGVLLGHESAGATQFYLEKGPTPGSNQVSA
jgi:integrase